MTEKHRHTVHSRWEWGYSGTVDRPIAVNPRAHGNIVVVESCKCGAYRETNVNGNHLERGKWGHR
jgi:hypothetical protein